MRQVFKVSAFAFIAFSILSSAHASAATCMDAYLNETQSIDSANGTAMKAALGSGAATSVVGTSTSGSPLAGIAGGAILSMVTYDHFYTNPKDFEKMIALLRDVQVGSGLALNELRGLVNAKVEASTSEIVSIVKQADESMSLCQDHLVTIEELAEHIALTLKK